MQNVVIDSILPVPNQSLQTNILLAYLQESLTNIDVSVKIFGSPDQHILIVKVLGFCYCFRPEIQMLAISSHFTSSD